MDHTEKYYRVPVLWQKSNVQNACRKTKRVQRGDQIYIKGKMLHIKKLQIKLVKLQHYTLIMAPETGFFTPITKLLREYPQMLVLIKKLEVR